MYYQLAPHRLLFVRLVVAIKRFELPPKLFNEFCGNTCNA